MNNTKLCCAYCAYKEQHHIQLIRAIRAKLLKAYKRVRCLQRRIAFSIDGEHVVIDFNQFNRLSSAAFQQQRQDHGDTVHGGWILGYQKRLWGLIKNHAHNDSGQGSNPQFKQKKEDNKTSQPKALVCK